jgi:hypothetical protein
MHNKWIWSVESIIVMNDLGDCFKVYITLNNKINRNNYIN